MSKNSIFYGVIILVLGILMFGSMKFYGDKDVGVGAQSSKTFGFTHEWALKH